MIFNMMYIYLYYSDGLKLRTPFWNLHTAITERHRGHNLTAEDNFITHIDFHTRVRMWQHTARSLSFLSTVM